VPSANMRAVYVVATLTHAILGFKK